LFSINLKAQRFVTNTGEINFFSETPIENIKAVNKKVSAAFDFSSDELVFQLTISDFLFPIPLMQEHFNENYLESDIYPKSFFHGKIIEKKNDNNATVLGDLTIHGITNKIKVDGTIIKNKSSVVISAKFSVMLKDYNIKVPKVVFYKIAEEIDIDVSIELKEYK
jgi:polyisoprenoid-binding protein YceI